MSIILIYNNSVLVVLLTVLANFASYVMAADEYLSIEQLWIEFKQKNGKVYGSLQEEYNRFVTYHIISVRKLVCSNCKNVPLRYNIWIDNYNYVQSENQKLKSNKASHTLGLNSFCDMVSLLLIFYFFRCKHLLNSKKMMNFFKFRPLKKFRC